jgi:hypothetical protein
VALAVTEMQSRNSALGLWRHARSNKNPINYIAFAWLFLELIATRVREAEALASFSFAKWFTFERSQFSYAVSFFLFVCIYTSINFHIFTFQCLNGNYFGGEITEVQKL